MERLFWGQIQELQVFFKSFFIFTILSGILDFFNMIVILNHYGNKGEEYQEISLLLLNFVFFGTNAYWVGYVVLLEYKFPIYIVKYF